MGTGIVPRVDCRAVAANVDLIGIPLDGSSDAVSQQFRKLSSVEDQREILRLLDAVNARVCVNTVVHRGNTSDLAAVADTICRHRSVVEWQLFQFMPIGPLGFKNRARYEIDADAYVTAVAAARRRLRELASSVCLVAKSGAARKHRYLLIDSDGNLWMPQQATGDAWSGDDANDRRLIVGNITDAGVLERLVSSTTLRSAGTVSSVPPPSSPSTRDGNSR
jgi:MoaA/NifB/PqqE/SkfB family radical SAM enzyme